MTTSPPEGYPTDENGQDLSIPEYMARWAEESAQSVGDILIGDRRRWEQLRLQGIATGRLDRFEELVTEEIFGTIVPTLLDTIADSTNHALAVVSYLCNQISPELDPEVRTEVYDREIRLFISVADRPIATLTMYATGGGEACVRHLSYRAGFVVEIDGDLANQYLCGDPAHHPEKA